VHRDDTETNQTEPPNVQIEYEGEEQLASIPESTQSTDNSQDEKVGQAAAAILDIAAEAEPPSVVKSSSS